jgi:predicted transcriptional regulator of viral defense system
MKYHNFTKLVEKPYFTRQELALRGISLYDAQLTLWLKNGYIERVKRGFYVFADRKNELTPFEVAFFLYEPSYISLESALSIHGLIPDMVQSVVSVATKPTRRFTNTYGHFIYHTVSPKFFFGSVPKNGKYGKYLMATPEKAIIDYAYFHRSRLQTQDDVRELRLNGNLLHEMMDKEKLRKYLLPYESPSLERTVALIFETCLPTKN